MCDHSRGTHQQGAIRGNGFSPEERVFSGVSSQVPFVLWKRVAPRSERRRPGLLVLCSREAQLRCSVPRVSGLQGESTLRLGSFPSKPLSRE